MRGRREGKPSIRPVDIRQVLGGLDLRMNLAARLCGISVRQLTYWTDTGIIDEEHAGRNRRYDWAAIEKACLIKQALDDGYSLKEAVKLVEEYLDRRAEEGVEDDLNLTVINGRPAEATPRRGAEITRRRPTLTGDLGKVLSFLESNPNRVFTAHQIGRRLGQPTDLVETALRAASEQMPQIQVIRYPRASLFRLLIPRRSA